MRIAVLFQFNHEGRPAAETGVEGDVSDILLPYVGDIVQHRGGLGSPFQGRVTDRVFEYDLPTGNEVTGRITITLFLDHTTVH